jgi:PST family polysaccharide transporter
MKLGALVLKGLKWSTVSQVGKQIIQYGTTLFLASVLPSEDFGLIAMAMVIVGFVEVFKDLGTGSAIIQKEKVENTLLSSIFWVNILFGITLSLLIFLFSPFIASFFSNSSVTKVLSVLSVTFFISSISIVSKSVLERNLEFDKLAKAELLSVIVGAITAVVLAINNFGVWSLVFQTIVSSTTLSILLLLLSQWKPVFKLNVIQIKSVAKYSGNLIGYNVFNYFVRNLDYILIGKFIGDQALGHYYLIYKIMLYPVQNISAVISRVMFPVYSKLQNDLSKFKTVYMQSSSAIALITFPLMLGIFAVSESFVNLFFPDKWDLNLLILLLKILAPIGLVQSICATTGPIYLAVGKTDWLFRWGILTGLFVGTGFFIGLTWGVEGVAVSYLITTLILVYPCFAIPFRLIDLKFIVYLKVFKGSFFSSLIMAGLVIFLNLFLFSNFGFALNFLSSIITGVIIYILLNFIFNRNQLLEMFSLIKNQKA